MPSKKLTFIDLFAGAGGLSEGFIQAGFTPVAHIEMNRNACETLKTRAAFHYLNKNRKLDFYNRYIQGKIERDVFLSQIPHKDIDSVICAEMSKQTLPGIFEKVDSLMKERKINHINVILGGPPCQAYSLVGRAQTSHMRHPMSKDPRNHLYKMYTQFLRKYQPDIFVFENVVGIKTALNGSVFKAIEKELKKINYHMEIREQNAKDFGALQNRKRIIIIGWKENSEFFYPDFKKITSDALVNDLLHDLPPLTPGEKNNNYFAKYSDASNYLKKSKIRKPGDILSQHECRPNTPRDVEIYRRTIEAWNDDHKRLKYDDLPESLKTHKNRTSFSDRFKVVEGDMNYCHTVLAHLSKDGHYFIHPDINQTRSISIREAARLQTFPDDYYFEGGRTAAFVQIGNAVPPMMAKQIALGIKKEF